MHQVYYNNKNILYTIMDIIKAGQHFIYFIIY